MPNYDNSDYHINCPCCFQLEGDDTGDFEATTAAAFLLSSEASKTVFIAVRDDELPEADETFIFNLRLQVTERVCVGSGGLCVHVCVSGPSMSVVVMVALILRSCVNMCACVRLCMCCNAHECVYE